MSNNAEPGTVAFVDAYDIYYNCLETQISIYLAMTGISLIVLSCDAAGFARSRSQYCA